MTRPLVSLVIALLLLSSPPQSDQPKHDRNTIEQLNAHLRSHYMTPEDYIISKFKDHEVVFLGENHRYKHDVELVQGIIPRLYQAGVFTLATEFARREDQPLVDRLLNGPTYDEALARQITFNQYVFWGYQEYVDVFKAAWRLNHGLPGTRRKFRILGVNCSPDWSVVQKEEDLYHDPKIMAKVWHGCSEEQWAKVILDEVVAKGEKALVYSGMHHAFTEYRQPVYSEAKRSFVRFGDVRMGNYVYNAIGKRAITISLHGIWYSSEGYSRPSVYAADGYIDAVMAEVDPGLRRAGFDTGGTPFGNLPGTTTVYKYGYDKFSLSVFCDGYVYQLPLSQYEGVTPIKDFVNQANLSTARAQSPEPKFKHASADDFNKEIVAEADIRTRLGSLR